MIPIYAFFCFLINSSVYMDCTFFSHFTKRYVQLGKKVKKSCNESRVEWWLWICLKKDLNIFEFLLKEPHKKGIVHVVSVMLCTEKSFSPAHLFWNAIYFPSYHFASYLLLSMCSNKCLKAFSLASMILTRWLSQRSSYQARHINGYQAIGTFSYQKLRPISSTILQWLGSPY